MRESQVRTCMPNFIVLALKCGPTASKIAIFGIQLPLRENLGGPQKKLNIGTTNLPLCNDNIIVLKTTLLHSISVIKNITNNRHMLHITDTQTRKHHTFSSSARARPTIPTILGMVTEEVRTIFASLTFFDLSSSFASKGYWKFVGKCPHHWKMLITQLTVPRKWPNWKVKIYLETCTNAENFVEIGQTSRPWGAKLWPKCKTLIVLGAVFPHFCPDKREIWHGGAVVCSPCQISPLLG